MSNLIVDGFNVWVCSFACSSLLGHTTQSSMKEIAIFCCVPTCTWYKYEDLDIYDFTDFSCFFTLWLSVPTTLQLMLSINHMNHELTHASVAWHSSLISQKHVKMTTKQCQRKVNYDALSLWTHSLSDSTEIRFNQSRCRCQGGRVKTFTQVTGVRVPRETTSQRWLILRRCMLYQTYWFQPKPGSFLNLTE